MDTPREPHSGPTGPPPLVTAPQCCNAPGSRAFRCRTPCATSSHISSCRPAAAPSLHPPPEQISPDPEALLHALAKRIWCSASFSPGNTRARPRASSRKVRRTLVLFANIATPALSLAPFLSVRDLRGPDLALERDLEDRPN